MKIYRTFLIHFGIFLIALSNANAADTRGLTRIVAPSFVTGKYHALVIGNNNYQDRNGIWRSLQTAANDASAVARVLKTTYGFNNVTLLIDATLKQTLAALNKLSDDVGPNDNVLVYYAGHGHMEDEKTRGYWIPVDAVGGDISTYLRNSTIRDEVNILAERAKHTLIISDSCFSGDLIRGGNRGGATEDLNMKFYEKVAKKKSVQVFTSGGKEFVDDSYRNSGHSPFTYFLLNELNSNNKDAISLMELANNVSIAVANNVQQTPESGILAGAGDELGQFIFVRLLAQNDQKEIIVGSGKIGPGSKITELENAPVFRVPAESSPEAGFIAPAARL